MTAPDVGPLPELPAGWTAVRTRGPGPFVTHAVLERPDGVQVEWTSRRHRKRLGLRTPGAAPAGGGASASSWWIGALFAVGSVCFALGSLPLFFDAVPPRAVGWTFFVGSVFFTSAAYLQYDEAVHAPTDMVTAGRRPWRLTSLLHWHPRRIDAWAATIQLVGTVFFNVSTFAATRADLAVDQDRRLVWAPDVLGSVCFLVASWLAYSEVNRGVLPRPDRSVGWWIAGVNLAGSVLFGAAAVGARYLRSTGELANVALVNAGTFLGAVGFLVGAVLLPVESARDRATG
ncbi:YrhK family protein [Cellulomonas sp.]|uniref:YrhK family protein n=1 Tax=Cellulomonas sp. TaxID=40001 RepID=UPI001B1CB45D|nr:YrhK family protein [Cellulomonas sp.]MBO9555674.1 YrhK family protein [Cellulomonas sp.]